MSSSGLSSQADIDAECRKVSLQMQKLARRHRDLRSQRNELALISRIPNELLQKVFLILKGAQPSEAGYRQVIQLTHVCRRWRRVGLGQPELWAYITDKQLQAVGTLLDRSKSVHLTMVLCCRSNEHARTPEALLLETKIQDALSRRVLRSLDICNDSEILGWRVGALPGGAPVLHTLRLWMVNTLKGAIELLSTKLPDIFPDGAPLLRRVLLRGCHLPWTSRLFEGLTSLEIHDRHPSIASSPAEFLDALGRMTKLEHLHLDIKVPDSNQPATKDRLVALPSLKSLYVEGSLSECIDFLEHVVIPGSAKVDVSVVYATGRGGGQSAPEGSSLQPRILKPSLDSDANPLASGSNPPEIAFTRSNPTSVIIDTDVDTCGTMRIRENMDLFTVILTSERYNTLTDGGRAVLASLPSTDIRSLAIRLFPREECFKLDELFPVLQSVEKLWVGEADGSLVIHTPLEDPCLFYGSRYPVQFLPALKALVFERVSIPTKHSPCINLQYRDGDFVVPPIVFGDLMNLLKLRAHMGYKLLKLQFGVADNLTVAQVEELETVVEEVVWSGVE